MNMRTSLLLAVQLTAAAGLAATADAGSVPAPTKLETLPYSGAVLVARAIMNGTIRLPASSLALKSPAPPRRLNCTPAPCAFRNVDASAGTTMPVNETPIAINPINRTQMITGGNDYNCGNVRFRGFWTSGDGGRKWSGECGQSLAGATGAGDPIVGYDLNGTAIAATRRTKSVD